MKRLLLSFVSRWWLSPLCILGCTGVLCGGLLLAVYPKSPTLRILSAILEVGGACGIVLFLAFSQNWEQYYAARFELWFRPDSGAPERIITQKVFRIQGWQR